MQQILDFLRVADDAKAHLGWSGFDFEWRLERASTNSPFSLTAVAEPVVAEADPATIIGHVTEVERITAIAFRDVARGISPPSWLTPDGAASLAQLHRRTISGLTKTRFDFSGDIGEIEVANDQASVALTVLERVSLAAPDQFPLRIAHGEIAGRMVSVGRWRNLPAFQITSAQYGLIWCVVSEQLMEQFGGDQTLYDVWKGKRVSVPGRVFYGQNGKPTRVEASAIRGKETPEINIEELLDADFTSGLSPIDYLEALHEGKLA